MKAGALLHSAHCIDSRSTHDSVALVMPCNILETAFYLAFFSMDDINLAKNQMKTGVNNFTENLLVRINLDILNK